MRHWNGIAISLLAAGLAGAQSSPDDEKRAATPDALRAQIEALREANVAWRNVRWRTCLLEAFQESAREKKPVFLWVLGGRPADGRC